MMEFNPCQEMALERMGQADVDRIFDQHITARKVYRAVFAAVDKDPTVDGNTAGAVATIAEMACRLAVSKGDSSRAAYDLSILMSRLAEITNPKVD